MNNIEKIHYLIQLEEKCRALLTIDTNNLPPTDIMAKTQGYDEFYRMITMIAEIIETMEQRGITTQSEPLIIEPR